MIDLKIDADGDLVLEGSDLAMVSGADELAQQIRVTLQTNLGEWFLDPALGLEFAVLLRKQPDTDAIRAEITRVLEGTGRIRSVDGLTVDFDAVARKIAVSFAATGIDGEPIAEEVWINA